MQKNSGKWLIGLWGLLVTGGGWFVWTITDIEMFKVAYVLISSGVSIFAILAMVTRGTANVVGAADGGAVFSSDDTDSERFPFNPSTGQIVDKNGFDRSGHIC